MLAFLEQYEGEVTLAALVIVFVLLSVCEAVFPRRQPTDGTGWRWLNNVGLAVITITVASWTQLILSLAAARWVSGHEFGLLQVWQAGWGFSVIITVVVLELAVYIYHRLMHRVPWLWRLHAVHHSDTGFDLTLAYRNHPLAAIFLLGIRLPVIVLLGPPVYAIVIYEVARVAQDLFSHSNVRIPERVENWLRYVIVTPDFHRLHHSSTRRFTDSNFSSTFPWFDYLFGTVSNKPYAEHEDLEVGLEYFRSPRDTRLDRLLLMPFRKF